MSKLLWLVLVKVMNWLSGMDGLKHWLGLGIAVVVLRLRISLVVLVGLRVG